jgi:DNA helicase-2/ATP-dependent DNA helicase PcrA
MNTFNEKLNQIRDDEYQYQAYSSDESTVVIAGPGSGKTTVLTLKIMRLLREKIHAPRGLACMTYNRAAANEFNERLLKLGHQERKNVFLGTVHSFCISEIILPFAHLYGYDIPLPLKLVSEKERDQLFKDIINKLKVELRIEKMDKERILATNGSSSVSTHQDEFVLQVAAIYEEHLHASGRIDFVDVVKYATQLIQNHKYVRDCLEAKFPWILIDEYQDLGKPLHEMVLTLLNTTKIKFFIVGDPNQSIYNFNGAIPDFLIELYNKPELHSIKLLTNFRSNQDIINASEIALQSKVKENFRAGLRIQENAEFYFHVCDTEIGIEPQIKLVVDTIIPECIQKGIPLHEICIMLGLNDDIKTLSRYCRHSGIPFHLTKRKDFDTTEVIKWLIRCAKWTIDKRSVSFENLFSFWLQLNKEMSKADRNNNLIPLRKKLLHVLAEGSAHSDSLFNWLGFILNTLNLTTILSDSNQFPDEVENLENLLNTCLTGDFSVSNINDFVQLERPLNQVSLSTRHSSKGLEFEVIVLLGMEEEHFPSYYTIKSGDPIKMEEEHRVFFVCVSRAKRVCHLVRSTQYNNKYGTTFDKAPSRFWNLLESHYGSPN